MIIHFPFFSHKNNVECSFNLNILLGIRYTPYIKGIIPMIKNIVWNILLRKGIIDIANKILKSNSKIDLSSFKKNYKNLKKESLKHSMNLIKSDLNRLGIKHDYFFSESKKGSAKSSFPLPTGM